MLSTRANSVSRVVGRNILSIAAFAVLTVILLIVYFLLTSVMSGLSNSRLNFASSKTVLFSSPTNGSHSTPPSVSNYSINS